ncbi:M48 family metalloprotease [bacterium]|nr:M48 family metalloprotease [bacterium]
MRKIFILLFGLIIVGFTGQEAVVAQEPDFRLRLHQLDNDYTQEDIEVEIEFGRNLAARILSTYKLLDNKGLQNYITLLGNGIATQVGRPELQYYFAVIDTDDINAYACPGGYIFFTKGAIKVMENEAQLAGVIAHEIWHVNFRHVVKPLKIRAKGDSLTSGIAAAIGSGTATARVLFNQLTEKAYQLLFEEGISREAELATDTAAVESLVTLGYDWSSYRDYLRAIESKPENKYRKVLSKTHPSITLRVESINNLAQSLNISDELGKKNANRYKSNTGSL